MANIAAEAILTRARELINDAYGDLRVISSTRFAAKFYPEMTDGQQSRRVVEDAVFDVRLARFKRHEAAPMVNSSIALYEVAINVIVARKLDSTHTLDDALRDEVLANAMIDADQLCQCLTYPGNMVSTAAGDATGLASGVLLFEESDGGSIIKADDEEMSFVRTVHTFRGIVQVDQQVASGLSPGDIDSVVHWYRADLGITLNGSTVSAWADQAGTADGAQSTAANQPTYSTSDSNFSNRPSIDCDGSNDYMTFGTNADFNHLHNGTGGTLFMVIRTPASFANAGVIGNNNTTGGERGFYFYQNSNGTTELGAGTGSAFAWFNNSGLTLSTSTTYAIAITYSSAAGYAIYSNGTSVASGAETSTPSVLNASRTMALGARAGIDSYSSHTWAEWATFNTVLSSNELNALFDYTERYGL
jgi:hypothetical protein